MEFRCQISIGTFLSQVITLLSAECRRPPSAASLVSGQLGMTPHEADHATSVHCLAKKLMLCFAADSPMFSWRI